MNDHHDVLIIGAGLSGIGMGCHLVREAPQMDFAIIERRQAVGGTWDLFRYPGIRSDADMFSFGFAFRPWDQLKTLADGDTIRQYIEDTAREHGVDRRIRFGQACTEASWSSRERLWTVKTRDEASGAQRVFTGRFLVSCVGYYDYDQGYQPDFPGMQRFQGRLIHPQHWPEDLDYSGKRVVVIGSGATAVTLVPAMAERAGHVTMLQRSPSYIISVPGKDVVSAALRRVLPERWVYAMARTRNIWLQRVIYKAARRWPEKVRAWLLGSVKKQLGGKVDMRHFTPSYMPWDERLCAVPDGDLFAALRQGRASVVTDRIATFTEQGIALESGAELPADIIISATGLQLRALGGIDMVVDGQRKSLSDRLTYKGVLAHGIPNMGSIFGYTNAPWTLKADIASSYLCRLFNHMGKHELEVCTPRAPEGEMEPGSVMGALQSGYVQRGGDLLPRQGRHLPWRVLNHYERDREMLLRQPIADTALEFEPAREPVGAPLAANAG